MILTTSKTIFAIEKIMSVFKVIFELTKFRLSLLVSFSAIFGFILATDNIIFFDLLVLGISGYFVTAGHDEGIFAFGETIEEASLQIDKLSKKYS